MQLYIKVAQAIPRVVQKPSDLRQAIDVIGECGAITGARESACNPD
jgi:hypothetical protein